MSRFTQKSRYVRFAQTMEAVDRRGRTVLALTPAELPTERELGEHLRRDGQRLDHLAAHYLDDPEGFWRLARLNDALTPDVLAERRRLKIPVKG